MANICVGWVVGKRANMRGEWKYYYGYVDIVNSDVKVLSEKRGRGGGSGMSRRVGNRE